MFNKLLRSLARRLREIHPPRFTSVGITSVGITAGLAGMLIPVSVVAQKRSVPPRHSVPPTLVFDAVTVIDVESGKALPDQRVVIQGNRILDVSAAKQVLVPSGARVIDAKGKYLIPGLWDMHIHPRRATDVFYPMLLANGITGFLDAGSEVPLDTLQRWRREILASARVGPVRQLFSGQAIHGPDATCHRSTILHASQICVENGTDAIHYIDSLHARGVDLINMVDVPMRMFFAVVQKFKRLHIPLSTNAPGSPDNDARALHLMDGMEAVNTGARYIDQQVGDQYCQSAQWDSASYGWRLESCQDESSIDRSRNAWFVAMFAHTDRLRGTAANAVFAQLGKQAEAFWSGTALHGNWLHDSMAVQKSRAPGSGTFGAMTMAQETNLPMVAGTDAEASVLRTVPPGFSLQAELAMMVAEGATPLTALRSATLNPAKSLWMVDSLGTVYPGKLADLVLLDANPLDDITNITLIRAVVANGRYYDRAALDQLLNDAQANAKAADSLFGNGR